MRVNAAKGDRPSYEVGPDDMIDFRPNAAIEPVVRGATELGGAVPPWMLADHDNLQGRVLRAQDRHEIDAPVQELLIVELYFK